MPGRHARISHHASLKSVKRRMLEREVLTWWKTEEGGGGVEVVEDGEGREGSRGTCCRSRRRGWKTPDGYYLQRKKKAKPNLFLKEGFWGVGGWLGEGGETSLRNLAWKLI